MHLITLNDLSGSSKQDGVYLEVIPFTPSKPKIDSFWVVFFYIILFAPTWWLIPMRLMSQKLLATLMKELKLMMALLIKSRHLRHGRVGGITWPCKCLLTMTTKMADNSSVHVTGRGKKKSLPSSRRVWTYEEEKELVFALKELVVRGLKCDNDFKSSYLILLENILASKFPGTDLKEDPHINSKIHVWKKQYACLKSMLGADPTALTGLKSSGMTVLLEVIHMHTFVGDDKNTEIHNNYEFTTTDPAFFTVGESSSATRDKGKGLKRKQIDNLDLQFIDTMINFSDKTDSRFGQLADTMGCIAKRVGSEYDACNRRG
ncbi:hypothetical protein ACS0TY_032741 [Phlomoides rotata]